METITGLDDLERAIKGAVDALSGDNLVRIADAASDVFMQAVEQAVPVKSGELKASLEQEETESRHRASSAVNVENSAKGQPVFYAEMLEYGTAKMSPHPFMRPAYEASKEAAEQAAIAEAQRIITGIK
jgi:HK97 gp10 family phage protein